MAEWLELARSSELRTLVGLGWPEDESKSSSALWITRMTLTAWGVAEKRLIAATMDKVEQRKWIDRSQPQTLQGAVMLSYMFAVFGLLDVLLGASIFIIQVALGATAYGIANEKRWAYYSTIALVGILALLWLASMAGSVTVTGLIQLLFYGVLFAMLVHPQSRAYQKIWFK